MFSLYLITLYILILAVRPMRKYASVLLPWLLFACSYDWMRLLPNYEVNPIDIRGLYELEKSMFGITDGGRLLTPNEFFQLHNCKPLDFLAGIFYLCWVPVPLAFAIYLYFKGNRKGALRFSWAFLTVNLVGFCGYYIHPASPPWYVMQYGFEPILNTPGNVAGLGRFDALIGFQVFHSIYSGNSNVFAAVPSLHAAYLLIATIYSVILKQHRWLTGLFAFICVGIWFTAIYTSHHYTIDVLLGILTAVVGILLFETAWHYLRK